MRQAYYSTSAIRCRLFPDHPHPLYYIALDHNSFALSHLEPSESSKELQPETIIGWITTKDSSFESPVLPGPNPLNFKPNPSYESELIVSLWRLYFEKLKQIFQSTALIHRILKKYVHEDPVLEALAKHQGLGYFNLNDHRTAMNYGRVSDPEDILGTVRLSDGQMVPGTYEK